MARIVLGSDHAGVHLKDRLVERLAAAGHAVDDVGTHGTESVDYPDFARAAAEKVSRGEAELGILVCGTGLGVSIAANKVPGIRAAVCRSEYEARMARQHNDANVLCLGERVTGIGLAEAIVDAFLAAHFEGGRHARRVEKIHAIEKEYA
ncbi:MAG: ribose 5-phosphate isomerase B [Deltaproteobacteria bacterium]|nr:MAG: ribose 5-phosphate isomerase B [Deltaproteobacteria bacterium]